MFISTPITYEISRIRRTVEFERKERKAQHTRILEDLKGQEEDIFKTIYNERKKAFETANEGLKYEQISEGKAGWQTKDAQEAMKESFSIEEQQQYQSAHARISDNIDKENAEYARIEAEMLDKISDDRLIIDRPLEKQATMLDNLVELIVYTRRGAFDADPDFGFEYWNHEYANVDDTAFNNNNTGREEPGSEGAKMRCEDSIRQSLASYAPWLKNVVVNMSLSSGDRLSKGERKVYSRHTVHVIVAGLLDDGIGTQPYRKDIEFLMEPAARH